MQIDKSKLIAYARRSGLRDFEIDDATQEAYLIQLSGGDNPESVAVQRVAHSIFKHKNKHSDRNKKDRNQRNTGYSEGGSLEILTETDLDDPEILEIVKKYGTDKMVQLCELYAYNQWYPDRKSCETVSGYKGNGRGKINIKKDIAEALGYSRSNTHAVYRLLEQVRVLLLEHGYDPVS